MKMAELSYEEKKELDNVSFTLRKNILTALVGESGGAQLAVRPLNPWAQRTERSRTIHGKTEASCNEVATASGPGQATGKTAIPNRRTKKGEKRP
jgi:ABC-type phosphate transport system ATPase subunit